MSKFTPKKLYEIDFSLQKVHKTFLDVIYSESCVNLKAFDSLRQHLRKLGQKSFITPGRQ